MSSFISISLFFAGCPLRGRQIYTLHGTLVCSEDYNKMTKNSTQQVHTSLLPRGCGSSARKSENKSRKPAQQVFHSGFHQKQSSSATMV